MKDEPVLNATAVKFIAGMIAMLAAKYLPTLGLTDMQAMTIATSAWGAISLVVGFVTRKKVIPTAKLAALMPDAHKSYMAMARRP